MEIDMSRKAKHIVKFALPAILLLAVVLTFFIYLYQQRHAYLNFYDAHVVGSFLQTKTMTNGTVEKILVDDGEGVTTGQTLAQIKPSITQADIDKLQQAADQAQQQYDSMLSMSQQGTTRSVPAPVPAPSGDSSSYQSALANEEKMQNLYNIGAISRAEFDRAAAAVDNARSAMSAPATASSSVVSVPSSVTSNDLQMAQTRLNQAKMALEEAQKDTQLTELKAAADGTAYYTNVTEGSNVTAGQNIIDIATSNYLWLEIKTGSPQAYRMQEGEYAECKIGDRIIGGTVEEILEPTDDDSNYTIKISIPSDKMGGIKPNMLATVKIAAKK